MPFVIGTDEAGLGPNLGPLVVSACLWHVDENRQAIDRFADLLGNRCSALEPPVVIADSKSVYQSGASLAGLEQLVLPALQCVTRNVNNPSTGPESMVALVQSISEQSFSDLEHQLFFSPEIRIPTVASKNDLRMIHKIWMETQQQCHVQLLQVRSAVIFPSEFNRLIEQGDNKSNLLTATTLTLVQAMLREKHQSTLINCDRHGGRKSYHSSIQQFLTDEWIHIDSESSDTSQYHWVENDSTINIQFSVKGERFPEIGLASMISKYVRELAMSSWNRFWQNKINDLKPTAGYPVDAKRFYSEIQDAVADLGYLRNELWRIR